MSLPRRWRELIARWRGLALDGAALGLVVGLGAYLRLVFLGAEPPLLLTTDSLTYALPAANLANGLGFDLSLRRPPGYPLLLAGLWALAGDDARALVWVQHGLGVATAGLTWLLGRLALGRLAGLLGGLAVALSGPQILYEQYLMTEALFTMLLVLGLLVLVLAVRRGGAGWFVAGGLLFGLCAATRPVGQIFPLLAPLAVLLAGRPAARRPAVLAGWARGLPWRAAGRATLLTLVGFAVVVAPWLVRNRLAGGELSGSAALGKTLFGRITRHDDGFRFDLPPAWRPESDPRRAEARALARQAAQRDTSRGSLVHERLRREFGYSEAEAYNVMRDVALEVILAQPVYFLWGSLLGALELFRGEDEPLREHLERLANPRLRAEWQQQAVLAPLLPAPVPPQQRWQTLERANWAVRQFQPSDDRLLGPRAGLFLLGVLAILLRAAWRPAAVIPLTAVLVLALSALLDGPVPRFRYPLDPLIALTAGAGLSLALEAVWRLVRRPRPASPELNAVQART